MEQSPSTSGSKKTASWSFSEKQRFIDGLNKMNFRKKDGNINWDSLAVFIGTKTKQEVKDYATYFNKLENGSLYPEFQTQHTIDVWKELAEKLTKEGDNAAKESIPQVFTVAALEPVPKLPYANAPNYKNIYNYLSSVLRGDTSIPDLCPDDAVVILELLEDLIYSLSNSETLIQRDFLHERYAELRSDLDENHVGKYSSTNPFGVPFDVLEFKDAGGSSEK